MDGFLQANANANRAQMRFGSKTNPMKDSPQEQAPNMENPFVYKSSTMGSLQGRIAWKTPAGASYTSKTRTSTLFDEPAAAANEIPRAGA